MDEVRPRATAPPARVLLVDNVDSFTRNIAQYLYEVTGVEPIVVPNSTRYEDLPLDRCDAVVVSPGPGSPTVPADLGVSRRLLRSPVLPTLGVCLGHQGIVTEHGGTVGHAPVPRHGIVDLVRHTGERMFAGLPDPLEVVRYHSLAATDVPDCLEVHATASDGVVMAVAHRSLPLWGVQFHPESICAQQGHELLANVVRGAVAAPGARGRRVEVRTAAPDPPPGPAPAVEAFTALGGVLRGRLEVETRGDDAPTPRQVLAGLPDAPGTFWLDDQRPGGQAEWSLVGSVTPGAVTVGYSVASRTLTMSGTTGGPVRMEGDLFDLLDPLLAAVDVTTPDDVDLPWNGGMVGWFGYELAELTLGVALAAAPREDAWFVLPREFWVFDHRRGLAHRCRVVDAEAPSGPWPPPVVGEPPPDDPPARFVSAPVPESELGLRDGREAYLEMIRRAHRAIGDGESYEVCLTTEAVLPTGRTAAEVHDRMRAANPVPFGALVRGPGFDVVGNSPELFLSVDGSGRVVSAPIKGTRRRAADPLRDERLRRGLAESVKERAENLMIVDLTRHDLNGVCRPGSVHVPELFSVVSYPSVHQLVSVVAGDLAAGATPLAPVRACFPPGSMTGAPKTRTVEILAELETGPRGVYSGALGFVAFDGRTSLAVVIRTAVLEGGVARAGIGGAITALSAEDEEFDEIRTKAAVVRHGVGPD